MIEANHLILAMPALACHMLDLSIHSEMCDQRRPACLILLVKGGQELQI